jgi:hypothetical protein
VPRSEVPLDRDGRIEWLWQRWEALDAWVDTEVRARAARDAHERHEVVA